MQLHTAQTRLDEIRLTAEKLADQSIQLQAIQAKHATQLAAHLQEIDQRTAIRNTALRNVFDAYNIPSNIICKSLGQTLNDFGRSFHVNDERHGVTISGKYYSLTTYNNFWRLLIEEQEARARSEQPPLVVRITHVTSIDLWVGTDAADRLNAQLRFKQVGGKIVRIIMRARTSNIDTSVYRNVVEDMRARYKITTSFTERDLISDLEDYLFIEDLGVSLWWRSTPSMELERCVLTADPHLLKKAKDDWQSLVTRLRVERQAMAETDASWHFDEDEGADDLLSVVPPSFKS